MDEPQTKQCVVDDGDLYVAGTANAGESLILIEQAKHLIAFGRDAAKSND